jgi:hypothetical protein
MRKPKPLPAVELLRWMFDYDPETGALTWKNPTCNRIRPGDLAGSMPKNARYRIAYVEDTPYKYHRICWAHFYGEDPGEVIIDHINRDRQDNRIANLRIADGFQSKANSPIYSNNTSGYKGVSWYKRQKRWVACICMRRRVVHLGYFDTPEDAHAAYCAAAIELHGDFANFG